MCNKILLKLYRSFKMLRALFLVNLFFITVFISSQQPSNIFGVLNFNNSARSTALGGYVVAVTDG